MMSGRRLFPGCILLAASACTALTEPPSTTIGPPAKPAAPAAAPQTAAPPTPPPTPPAAAAPAPEGETVAAAHVLVAYAGALRADPAIKRTKDEALKRAQSIATRAKKGEDFAKLADEDSDDPSAKVNHGSLGRFTRDRMVKPFADAAFALRPGDVSGAVETPFGYHVIKRTE